MHRLLIYRPISAEEAENLISNHLICSLRKRERPEVNEPVGVVEADVSLNAGLSG
jgi:hypothetical protein